MMASYGAVRCSPDELCGFLRKSNLVDEAEFARVEGLASGAATGEELAGRLVVAGLLTRWQAEQLLSGRTAFLLGRYLLLRKLGAGGMGAVYLARHTTLKRLVAVKVLAPALVDSPKAIARFHREMQIAAALDHPHIVRSYDAESVGDTHFLVMEHIDGADLEQVVEKLGPLPAPVACELVRQAADALEYARGRGVVHRDLKPANLLVLRRGDVLERFVKVLDMGLARLANEREGGLTGSGDVMGTPDYIAPEQIRDTRGADTRSDIFSLGCTLYRLLTARVPFPGASVIEKLTARLDRDAPRLSEALRGCPPALDAVVACMLARSPASRFQTPGEVADALLPFCDDRERQSATGEASGSGEVLETQVLSGEPSRAALTETVLLSSADKEPIEARRDSELDNFLGALSCAAPGSAMNDVSVVGRRRRLNLGRWAGVGVVAAAALLLGAGIAWQQSGRAEIEVEWNEADRSGGELRVGGRRAELPLQGPLVIPGAAGSWTIALSRPGFETLEYSLEAPRGGRTSISPQWKPLPETIRREEWLRLKDRIEREMKASQASAAVVGALRSELTAFHRRWPAGVETTEARALSLNLPWPINGLARDRIPQAQANVLGLMRPESLPSELVAVLGDGRLKHFGRCWFAFHPDGTKVISTGYDHSLREWDLSTGELLRCAVARERLYQPVFSPDGRFVAAAAKDGTIRRWRLETFGELSPLGEVATKTSLGIAFAPDGRLAAIAANHRVQIWSADAVASETPGDAEVLELDSSLYGCGEFSSDARWFAQGGETVTLWDVAQRTLVRELPSASLRSLNMVSMHPNEPLLATSTGVGLVAVWNIDTGETVARLKCSSSPGHCNDVAYSPDGRLLAAAFELGKVAVWDAVTHEERAVIRIPETGPTQIEFSPDGTLLGCSARGGIRLWNCRDFSPLLPETRRYGWLNDVAVTTDGRFVLGAGGGGVVHRWDLSNGAPAAPFDLGDVEEVRQIETFTRESGEEWVVAAAKAGPAILMSLAEPTRKETWAEGGEGPFAVSMDSNRRWTAALLRDGEISIWDLDRLARVASFPFDGDLRQAIGFDASTQRLVAGTRTELVELTTFGGVTQRRPWHSGSLLGARFVRGDEELVTASAGGSLQLWRTAARQAEHTYLSGGRSINAVDVSFDGRWIAAVGDDNSVRVWKRSQRWGEPQTFHFGLDDAPIRDVAFTPDGRHVVTANENGIVMVLRLDLDETNRPK